MPQSTNKTAIRVLLWWAAILSIIQAVFVVLFFTLGHFGKSQDSSTAGESSEKFHGSSEHLQPPSELGAFQDKARMFTFQAKRAHTNRTITWYAVDSNDLPTDDGQLGRINVKKDGYFFWCLRITLLNCNTGDDKWTKMDKVNLVKDNEAILVGWMNNQTCSTGLLCKMERLSAGSTLKVEITKMHPEKVKIDLRLNHTYLQAIYMPK